MNSPHHRDNILGRFGEIGVAYSTSAEGRRYWCTTFGLPPLKLAQDEAVAGRVSAVNQARDEAGKPPMRVSPAGWGRRAESGQGRWQAAPAFDACTRKPPPSYAAEALKTGYRARLLGEAAASGQPTPEEVVKTWIDEPIHRENFLGKFTEIGAGYALGKERLLIT